MAEQRGGPRVSLMLSCSGCMYEHSESYVVQGDSGFKVYCMRSNPARRIGDTTWDTPEWCPLRDVAVGEFAKTLSPPPPAQPARPERAAEGSARAMLVHYSVRGHKWADEVLRAIDAREAPATAPAEPRED